MGKYLIISLLRDSASNNLFDLNKSDRFLEIYLKNPKKIEVRFWERGVGQTNFSGTGACAALVASVLAGFTDRKVQVESSGGASEVCWNSENNLSLTGAAHLVFEGKYYKENL